MDQQQPYQQVQPSPSFISPVDKYGSSIVFLTDPTNDLYKYELFLRSLKEEGKELIQIDKPKANDAGINSIMGTLQSLVHQTGALTYYDDKIIKNIMIGFIYTLCKDVMINHENYGIDQKSYDLIIDNTVRFAYSFVMKSFKEGERAFWGKNFSEIKNIHEMNEGKRGGFSLNPLKFLKGGQ
jgi:hypothetical protein